MTQKKPSRRIAPEQKDQVHATVPLDVKAKLESAAAEGAESLASYVRRVLVQHAKDL
jgi:hypothetical protein